ncbi:uncharacterized protein BDZ99DRAFT_573231 [Mytilinidion resinicola]|uniref:Integral membrane protein n=1 Tax=Mytilinidion resinicola TaxID=574789 RepID=A0A6A6YFQ2_9PEZI|nr:uncharacterized protein BDZ99DRAFT_573231 [Mytilinidion resinicola]KAF2807398.1 hypothetical protein BDZ99DRAFT_573231 [Mytilinidion resinicola]
MPSLRTSLRATSLFFGPIFIAFGVNAMLRSRHSLAFFPFPDPATSTSPASQDFIELLDALLVIYGARDIFMGIAILAAATFGDREGRALGWIMAAAGAVAGVDGWVVRGFEAAGGNGGARGGEWGHWGYAPVLGVVGGVLVGL